MQVNPKFWAGKRVCVTGGTGFLGWHIVQNLLPLTPHVRILGLQPASPQLRARLQALDCVIGDVRDAAAVRRALRDCDVVFHAAGTIAMWGPGLKLMHAIHVGGTEQVVQALPPAARLVHTSSVTAIGASTGRTVLTEAAPFGLEQFRVAYVQAKRNAEQIALAAAARGLDVTVVNPGHLFGPEDYEQSAMGRVCLRCWKGRVPVIPPGGINCVDVRDAARGHLLAAERGRAGQRYILGGENLTMGELMHQLAQTCGRSSRWRPRLPKWLFGAIACCAELRGYLKNREPYPSLQHYRLSRRYWFYSSERARVELGYRPRPLRESLRDAHAWACRHGYLPLASAGNPNAPEVPTRDAA